MNAWINATKISIKYINSVKAMEIGEKPIPTPVLKPAKIKISEIKQIIIM